MCCRKAGNRDEELHDEIVNTQLTNLVMIDGDSREAAVGVGNSAVSIDNT